MIPPADLGSGHHVFDTSLRNDQLGVFIPWNVLGPLLAGPLVQMLVTV